MVLIRRYINDNKLRPYIRIIGQVHDEIVTEVTRPHAEQWSKILPTLMVRAARFTVPGDLMKSDTLISDYWMKEPPENYEWKP